ncbi:diphthamide biosynthesis protein [Basidiobolus meristosporus CBS 931.73]|uniref:2-(3-amino-3-carboxypropyl)histidine synthase subunit 2 n=1 Tax=Basidiobolus meristosporus CBS 931.73 TaxID=1314790 RepID=A0A1Y1Y4J6_9FUNG|nr:diphthamide biosynthesis protein [Basidiobolus meristosporus CBS 931.73]|eukprot:ORX92879.1 diphthamide biosynthesis protein [Basidiobolus meristosporus CBS 931.73]
MSTTLSGPATFADDGSSVIERTLEVHSKSLVSGQQELQEVYEVQRCVKVILEGGYHRVALQFSDDLLSDAADVASTLRKLTGQEIFILADTSYGNCCVDEVAAQHIRSRLDHTLWPFLPQPVSMPVLSSPLLALSNPLLNLRTARMPVLYVFGRHPIDTEDCVEKFEELFQQDRSQPIGVVYDVIYAHCIDEFAAKIRERGYDNVAVSTVRLESIEGTEENGRNYNIPEGKDINDYTLFYIGTESLTLTNILMTKNKCTVFSYQPETKETRKESAQVNRSLMKRYFLVQKAKDADVVGIVVGTLGVSSYMSMIEHLKSLIQKAGKKPYVFVMGKLNVAKMANFMEIDIYVLVACPENSLIDSKEFYRPVVTPFELEIALSKTKEWTGDYVTEFQELIRGEANEGEAAAEDASESDDEPHFSLVTGQFKQSRKYGKQADNDSITDAVKDLTLRDQNNQISTLLGSAAGEYLSTRSFRGLQQDLGESKVEKAEEGRAGIARGYSHEPPSYE